MIWREPNYHFHEYYFCLVDLKGFNRHQEKISHYSELESSGRPMPYCEEASVTEFSDLPDVFMVYDAFYKEVESSASDGSRSVFERSSSSIPEQFKKEELSDLIRDLNLSKEGAEVLASRFKDKICLRTGASILLYERKRITSVF